MSQRVNKGCSDRWCYRPLWYLTDSLMERQRHDATLTTHLYPHLRPSSKLALSLFCCFFFLYDFKLHVALKLQCSSAGYLCQFFIHMFYVCFSLIFLLVSTFIQSFINSYVYKSQTSKWVFNFVCLFIFAKSQAGKYQSISVYKTS